MLANNCIYSISLTGWYIKAMLENLKTSPLKKNSRNDKSKMIWFKVLKKLRGSCCCNFLNFLNIVDAILQKYSQLQVSEFFNLMWAILMTVILFDNQNACRIYILIFLFRGKYMIWRKIKETLFYLKPR